MTERTQHILALLTDCTPAERQFIQQQLTEWPADLPHDWAMQLAALQQPPVPDDLLGRFNDLLGKHFRGMLNDTEEQEFGQLVQAIETRKAQHSAAVENLAQAMGITAETLRARYLNDGF